jgi:hypothetical protein
MAAARILVRLDQAILQRAPSVGPHLFFSPLVMDRLTQWREIEQNGPELFDKLGKALKCGSLARRGKAKLPVEPWMADFKAEAQRELRTLQHNFKTTVLPRRRKLTEEKLRDEVEKMVHRPDNPFPVLLEHWTSFKKLPLDLVSKLFYGQIGPARFADTWIARSLGRDAETVRQDLSGIRPTPRPRRRSS